MQSIFESQFIDIFSQSEVDKKDQKEYQSFKQDILNSTKNLFEGDKQEFIIIWGDPNVNQDNENFDFLKNRITQFSDSQSFRKKSLESAKKNVLFLMSGSFANYVLDGKTNLEWVNKNIAEQKIHSKSIILFTSMKTVRKNNWTIENLQQKFQYVTQLTIDYDLLFKSFNKMIYNRIHRSFVQVSHLDFYFRSDTSKLLGIFQKHDSITFQELKKQTNNLSSQILKLCEYVKNCEVQSPLTLYLSKLDINQTVKSIEKSFQLKDETKEEEISSNFVNLYTKEDIPIYKILNFALNIMNPQVYKYLEVVFKILSKSLYQYEDKQIQSEISLFRGAAIQKYQYDTMYEEYIYNKNNNRTTFITFPQFLSTSSSEKIAEQLAGNRIKEVKVETTGRIENLNEFSAINKEYLQSDEFKKAYKVIVYIDAKFDPKNKYKPKSIEIISAFKVEKEYLFQPFQTFQITSMDQPTKEGQSLKIHLKYRL